MPKRTVPTPEAEHAEAPAIDMNAFNAGEQVVYYDTARHAWKKGALEEVPVADGKKIKIKVGGAEIKAGPVLKKLEMPSGEVTINGVVFHAGGTAADLQVGPEGEILCDLVSADGKEKMEHVDVEMIKNIKRVETIEADIDNKFNELKSEIAKVSSIKKKELTGKFNDLQRKLDQLVSALGAKESMGEVEDEQIKSISAEIKKMEKELNEGLNDLSREVERITGATLGKEITPAEIAGDLLERRDSEIKNSPLMQDWETRRQEWAGKKDARDKWDKNKKNWEDWKVFLAGNPDDGEKDKWKKKRKIKDDPEDPGAAPADAGNEPKKPEGYEIIYGIYEELKTKAAANQLEPAFTELLRAVKEKSDRKIKTNGLGTDIDNFAAGKEELVKEIIGKVMVELLEAHKKEKGEAKKEDVFDFNKDKAELEAKIAALTAEAQATNVEALVKKCTAVKENIGKLKEGDKAEKDMIQIWDELSALEMEIFTAKRKAAVEKKPEKEIDIPDNVLVDIFKDHPKEVAAAMRAIYEDELGAAEGGGKKTTDRVLETMKNLFGGKPDAAALEKLRQCGIRSWDQFKKLWDKKYAQTSAVILHQWAQDDLRGDVARRTSSWDRIKAIKGQLAVRIATNLVLVGGGAIAATALFASGGLAGIGLAAAGGAAGGGVRAALQKFLFGRRGFEERKQKKLQELAGRKKQEAIAELMEKRFGAKEDKFEAGTENMFATLVAEAIREVNAEAGKKEVVAGGPELAGKAKAIYIQSLKEFKWEGEEPTDEQKRQFAVAINMLMEKGQAATQEAVRNADPMVIRLLDGLMAGYSGTAASKDKYGWKGAVKTTGLGALAGVAFFSSQWQARAAVGALGGAAAGYHYGEGKRLGRLEKEAESQITGRLIQADKWRKEFEKETISPEDTETLCEEIKKFSRYLKGTADSEAEENIVALLQSPERAVLRKQMENIVYESFRRGLFAHLAILQMQERSDVIAEKEKMGRWDKIKKWLKKTGERTGYTMAGALAGAAVAVAAGEGIKEVREYFGIGPGSLGRKLGLAQDGTGKAAVGVAEVTAAGAARSGAGAEELAGAGKTGAGAETIQGSATLSKGQGILHGADKLMHNNPDYFKGWSKQQIHDWKVQELQEMGFKFKGGKWGYPVTVHEGAKVNLVIGADGKPHLQLGAEHVTEHKYYKWEEADMQAKQAEAHEAIHRGAAVKMETEAEIRGEELPLAEQKLSKAQLRAGEEIYTRVDQPAKAGAVGVAGEEIVRHERAHKANDALAEAKAMKAAAMPQEEVGRKPRGARAKVEAIAPEEPKAEAPEKIKTAMPESEAVLDNIRFLHTEWDKVFIDYYADDNGGVMDGLMNKLESEMQVRPELQGEINGILHNGGLEPDERLEKIVDLLTNKGDNLTDEQKLLFGGDFIEDDKTFGRLPRTDDEGNALYDMVYAKDGSKAVGFIFKNPSLIDAYGDYKFFSSTENIDPEEFIKTWEKVAGEVRGLRPEV